MLSIYVSYITYIQSICAYVLMSSLCIRILVLPIGTIFHERRKWNVLYICSKCHYTYYTNYSNSYSCCHILGFQLSFNFIPGLKYTSTADSADLDTNLDVWPKMWPGQIKMEACTKTSRIPMDIITWK